MIYRSLKEKKHPEVKGVWNLHDPETNEPVMTVKPAGWGRETRVEWHPDFLEKHKDLANSYEWGNPAKAGEYKGNSFKSRSDAVNAMNGRYMEAARAGFRDTIHTQKERLSDEEFEKIKDDYAEHHQNDAWAHGDIHRAADEENVRRVTHYSDPETGERIITHRFSAEHGKHVYSINPKYLTANNIDKDVARTLIEKNPDVYRKAVALFKNKGKQARLTGRTMSSDGAYHTYKVNGAPEEASTAHEEAVQKRHPGIQITRTGPTTFTGIMQPQRAYDTGKFVTSHIIGDTLHTTTSGIHHPDSYSSKKNTDIIEQFAQDPVRYFINFIKEEGEGAPTNAVGGGNIAGAGIGPQGEPGVKKKTYQQKNRAQAPSPIMSKSPLKRLFAGYTKE